MFVIANKQKKKKYNNNNLPILALPKNYIIVEAKSVDVITKWITDELTNKLNWLGIDLEWKADFNINGQNTFNSASFLQLATPQSCLVIHIRDLKGIHIPCIESLMSNKTILKFGIGIEMDKKKFTLLFPSCNPTSWYDLGETAKKNGFPAPGTGPQGSLHGAFSLCNDILHKFYQEVPEITFTDWSKAPIDEMHVNYMALDAWMCTEIAALLLRK